MAFADNELSVSDASPIELYKFVGTAATYRMTSYNKTITNSEGTYIPVSVSRSNNENASQDQSDLGIDITMPFDHPIIQEYVFGVGMPELTLTLYRAHRENYNDTVILWTGKPLAFTVEGRQATLRVPSLFAYLLRGLLPAPRYQAPCNHLLYDARCGLDANAAANSYTTTVVSKTGNNVVVALSDFANGVCNAGEMVSSFNGERRMIISNTGTTFRVNFPFSNLPNGETVRIHRGCDHAFETCRTKFSNGINYGGFPLIPPDNPFAKPL